MRPGLITIFINAFIIWVQVFPAHAESAPQAESQTAVGIVILAANDFKAVSVSSSERALKRGDDVFLGDTLVTGKARAQVRFKDGASLAIRPDTQIKIDEYYFDQNGKTNKSSMSLIKGSFRKITGLITKTNPEAYKVTTPVAVMSVRGTTYEASLIGEALGVEFIDGQHQIAVSNAHGETLLYAGGPKIATVQRGFAPQARASMPAQFKAQTPCTQ